jgi:anti-sigma regulatory factor (Ser/Thr protein kinase)
MPIPDIENKLLPEVFWEDIGEFMYHEKIDLTADNIAKHHAHIIEMASKTGRQFNKALKTILQESMDEKGLAVLSRNKCYQDQSGTLKNVLITELLANEYHHSKSPFFEYGVFMKDKGFYIATREQGKGFDLEEVLKKEEILTGTTATSGRGLFIIKKLTDTLYTSRDAGTNTFSVYTGLDLERIAREIISS